MNLVRPINSIDVSTYQGESVILSDKIWYEYEIKDSYIIGIKLPNVAFPRDTVFVKQSIFENYFVTKEQDRDIKIDDIIE